MPNLDAIHSLASERFDPLARSALRRMRENGETAGTVDEADRIAHGEPILRDERRTSIAARYRSKASRKSTAHPSAIIARATCGRPIAPPAACSSTASNSMRTPSSFSRWTMRVARERRISRSATSVALRSCVSERWRPRMCVSTSASTALSSTPARRERQVRAPSATASAMPSSVS